MSKTRGQAPITITGTALTATTAVTIGGTDATNLQVISATSVTATTPAHTAGTVDVALTTPDGTATKTGAYTYEAPTDEAPLVTAIEPATGPTVGGTTVTIAGAHFVGTSEVLFGAIAASSYSVDSDTQITAMSPAADVAGAVAITVKTSAGTSEVTAASAFTYSSECGDTYASVVDVSGIIQSDAVWGPECAGAYVLHAAVEVSPDAKLTLLAGADVEGTSGSSLRIKGSLVADGTATKPVILTSAGISSGLLWVGISVLDGGSARLSDASLRYALMGVSVDGGGSADVARTQFLNNTYDGLVFNAGSQGSVAGTEFNGGSTGLQLSNGAEVKVDGNAFIGLTTGILLMDPSTVVSNCSFDGITGDTISVSMGTTPFDPANLDHGNTATNSAVNGVWLKDPVFADGAILSSSSDWGLVISNYGRSPQTVNVPAGAAVTIPAGAVVKFRDQDLWPNGGYNGTLNIAGTLRARGTLTVATDDVGGATMPTNGSAQFWGLTVLDGGEAHLTGASVRYAAIGVSVYQGGSAEVADAEFVNNMYGILFSPGGRGSVVRTEFVGGGTGIHIPDGADVTVDEDSFTGLTTGILLMDPSTVVSNCSFDRITGDTISVSMGTTPFDPANLDHGNTATNSAVNGLWLKDPVFADGATLSGHTGWGLAISNYGRSPQPVNVPAGSTVTIPAGAVVKFRFQDLWPNGSYDGSLRVAGTLNASGILTKFTDDTAAGAIASTPVGDPNYSYHFSGITVLDGGKVRTSGASIRYAVLGLSVFDGGSASVSNTEFVETSYYGMAFSPGSQGSVLSSAFGGGSSATGLSISAGADVTVDGDSFTGLATGISLMDPSTVVSNCSFDGITQDTIAVSMGTTPFDPANFGQGNLATNSAVNGVWLKDPVFADGAMLFGHSGWGLVISNHSYGPQTVNVPVGATLSIPAGVVVKFRYRDMWPNGAYVGSLNVAGTLKVHGTTDTPVVLTSAKDDSVGGDTNNDGDGSSPAPNDWSGIVVGAGARLRADGMTARYASTCVTVTDALSVEIHGDLSLCVLGISSDTSMVDATHVQWGHGQPPGANGNPGVAGSSIMYYPWVGGDVYPLISTVPSVQSVECQDFVIMGLRGSGEEAPFGPKVSAIVEGVTSSWDGDTLPSDTSFRAIDIPYEANPVPIFGTSGRNPWEDISDVGNYMPGAWDGSVRLISQMEDTVGTCRNTNTKIVLVGYSQGAWAIHAALEYLGQADPSLLDRVAAVALLADPLRSRRVNLDNVGSAEPHDGVAVSFLGSPGLGYLDWVQQLALVDFPTVENVHMNDEDYPTSMRSKTLELCAMGDAVCDTSYITDFPQNLSIFQLFPQGVDIHGGYSEGQCKWFGSRIRELISP